MSHLRPGITTLTLVACVAFAGKADAHDAPHPTPAEAIAIADAWAAKDVPELPNHCSGGRLNVTYGDYGTGASGWAEGWIPMEGGHRWDHAKCDVTIVPGLHPAGECWVRAHELMHFVIGPQHEGPLDRAHPGAIACYTTDFHSVTADDDPAGEVVVVRSRKAIARTIRYRRTMAKIKARAFLRAAHGR